MKIQIADVECILLIGLPAAGKSTFYRERFATTHDHVSKDLSRHARRPQRRQEQLVAESLARGRSVVIDNTNASAATRAPVIALAKKHGAQVIGYFFPTEARDALRRNRDRQGRDRVPDVAIFAIRKHLQPPSFAEGFDRLFVVTINETDRKFDVEESFI